MAEVQFDHAAPGSLIEPVNRPAEIVLVLDTSLLPW